jgi:hypothetical protein
MDGFFSAEISNTLQLFTFPLEVIGLSLAAIEVRFPMLAARMGEFMLRDYEKALVNFSLKTFLGNFFHPISKSNRLGNSLPAHYLPILDKLVWLMYIVVIFAVFYFSLYPLYTIGHTDPALTEYHEFLLVEILPKMLPDSSFRMIGIVFLVFSPLLVALLLPLLMMSLYRFLNHWVPGRTVGTLGIFIAGFGVLGESYQFFALMFT